MQRELTWAAWGQRGGPLNFSAGLLMLPRQLLNLSVHGAAGSISSMNSGGQTSSPQELWLCRLTESQPKSLQHIRSRKSSQQVDLGTHGSIVNV